ncbi:hypothetical protein D3C83_270750 [compost metagenome]
MAVVLADLAHVDMGTELALEVHELVSRYVADHDPQVVDVEGRFQHFAALHRPFEQGE